jgi:hypothetical protein
MYFAKTMGKSMESVFCMYVFFLIWNHNCFWWAKLNQRTLLSPPPPQSETIASIAHGNNY